MTSSTAIVLAFAMVVSPIAASAGQTPPITVKAKELQDTDSFYRVVKYGDLNLASADGAAMLKARVVAAARSGCIEVYGLEPLNTTVRERGACASASIANAMDDVDRVIQMAARGEPVGTQIAIVMSR